MLYVACLAWKRSKHGINIYLPSFCPDENPSLGMIHRMKVKFQGLTWPLSLTLTPTVCHFMDTTWSQIYTTHGAGTSCIQQRSLIFRFSSFIHLDDPDPLHQHDAADHQPVESTNRVTRGKTNDKNRDKILVNAKIGFLNVCTRLT